MIGGNLAHFSAVLLSYIEDFYLDIPCYIKTLYNQLTHSVNQVFQSRVRSSFGSSLGSSTNCAGGGASVVNSIMSSLALRMLSSDPKIFTFVFSPSLSLVILMRAPELNCKSEILAPPLPLKLNVFT